MPAAAFCPLEVRALAIFHRPFRFHRQPGEKALSPKGLIQSGAKFVFSSRKAKTAALPPRSAQILAAPLYIAISTNEQYYLFNVLYIFYISLATIKESAKSPKISTNL